MTTQIEERLIRDLSTRESAWVLGRKLGIAALDNAQHVPVSRVKATFDEALLCAERLGVAIPSIPHRTGEQARDGQLALLYLLREAGGAVADKLVKEHSKQHRALFEAGLKLQILSWLYKPGFDMALALCEAIERAVSEAELPTPLWSGLVEKVRTTKQQGAAVEQVHAELRATERAIWAHLLANPASLTRGATESPRRRAWELGEQLATAAVARAQGDPIEVVRPAFQRAEALAADLGIRLPALPSYDPQNARKTSADAVVYLLRDAGMQLSAHLREQHSVVHAALFEFSSKATLLEWLYTPSDATCEALTRFLLNNASQEANLPRRLSWHIFEGVVVKKLPAAQLKPLIKQALQEIERSLSEKPKGSITVGDKRSLTLPFLKQVPGGLVLSVTFNGSVSAPMLYDTGATTTIIDLATSRRLGISLEKAMPFIVNTANGQVQMDMVEIDSVEVSGVKVEGPFELIVSRVHGDKEYAGLLGLNFSRAFVTTIDYDRNTITFHVR